MGGGTGGDRVGGATDHDGGGVRDVGKLPPGRRYGRPIFTRPGRLAETLRTFRPRRGASIILPSPT